ncbi:MAG: hypothetical protein ACFFFH_14385 [Candidatus Thorarchaeota archaeon]
MYFFKSVDGCPEDVYEIVNGKVNAGNIEACLECAAYNRDKLYDAILDHCSW